MNSSPAGCWARWNGFEGRRPGPAARAAALWPAAAGHLPPAFGKPSRVADTCPHITLTQCTHRPVPATVPRMPTTRGRAPATRARTALVLLLAAAALPSPMASIPQFTPGPVTVTAQGVNYVVTTMSCYPTSSCDSSITASAVWGNEALANAVATALAYQLGDFLPSGQLVGPPFMFAKSSSYYTGVYLYNSGKSNALTTTNYGFNTPQQVALAAVAPPSEQVRCPACRSECAHAARPHTCLFASTGATLAAQCACTNRGVAHVRHRGGGGCNPLGMRRLASPPQLAAPS